MQGRRDRLKEWGREREMNERLERDELKEGEREMKATTA